MLLQSVLSLFLLALGAIAQNSPEAKGRPELCGACCYYGGRTYISTYLSHYSGSLLTLAFGSLL